MDSTVRSKMRLSTAAKPPSSRRRGGTPAKQDPNNPPPPKPTLSVEEQLQILENPTAYWKSYGTLANLYKEREMASTNTSASRTVTKNLLSFFQEAEEVTQVLSSTRVSDDDREKVQYAQSDDYGNRSWYIKEFDKLNVYFEMVIKNLDKKAEEDVAKTVIESGRLDKIASTLAQMEYVYTTMKAKFVDKTSMDNLKLFDKSKTKKEVNAKMNGSVGCHINMQDKVLDAFYEVKQLMEEINHVVETVDSKVTATSKIDDLRTMIETIVSRLEDIRIRNQEANDLIQKAEDTQLAYDNLGSTSSEECSPASSSSFNSR